MEDEESTRHIYHQLIDHFVERANGSVAANLLTGEGVYSRSPAATEANAMARSLSEQERSILAQMLLDERAAAIGDVLSTLQWWISSQGLKLTVHGQEMPTDLSGMGIHMDFANRLAGGDWPDSEDV